jgi:branched-chain amino acid transport system permease protein
MATLLLSNFWAFVATNTLVFAVLGLSLVVLTGWSGQVSLMPGTFAGVGACLAWVLGTKLGFPFALVLPLAALGTIPACALVGYAALRLRPLYLAVGTVAMAGLFEETLFRQGWFANGGKAMHVSRPGVLAGDHAFALVVVALAGALFAATAALGRSRTGRALRMVRDNDVAASAGGANPVKYRLLAFALSAAYAGLAGALFAYLLGSFSTAAFGFLVLSLSAFGLAIVGGIRSPLGAAVGAFAFVYLTEVFRSRGTVSDWTSVLVGAGMIAVLAFSPDGIVGFGQRVLRRRTIDVGREPDVTADVLVEVTGG